jgi:hypothetical protein
MECVILIRMSDDCVTALMDIDDDSIWVAQNFDDAVRMADGHFLCQAKPFQIVELDEL